MDSAMFLPSMIGREWHQFLFTLTPDQEKSLIARGGHRPTAGPLQFAVPMKDGSTVEDVYEHLKKVGALGGMFVRAEGMATYGGRSRQLRKEERVGRDNRIMKIMTNKNRSHASV